MTDQRQTWMPDESEIDNAIIADFNAMDCFLTERLIERAVLKGQLDVLDEPGWHDDVDYATPCRACQRMRSILARLADLGAEWKRGVAPSHFSASWGQR